MGIPPARGRMARSHSSRPSSWGGLLAVRSASEPLCPRSSAPRPPPPSNSLIPASTPSCRCPGPTPSTIRPGRSNPSTTAPRASSTAARPDVIRDGEIVSLDPRGRPVFNELLRGRGYLAFAAFDLLWLDGRDLRGAPLGERKRELAALLP